MHRGPKAPSGDKSYLYNATSSRSLINITVSFIAAKCPRVFEHEERLECGALNIRAAAEETRGHKPRPFMCLRAGGRLTSLRFTLVNFCLAADVSARPSRFLSPTDCEDAMREREVKEAGVLLCLSGAFYRPLATKSPALILGRPSDTQF